MSSWDLRKSQEIRDRHGAGFEELLVEGERQPQIFTHPSYPDQVRLLYIYKGYPWEVVYEPARDRFANAWPARKHKGKTSGKKE